MMVSEMWCLKVVVVVDEFDCLKSVRFGMS